MPDAGREVPPGRVLRAFGADEPAHPMLGGQGTSWRAGDVVLKPTDDVEVAGWLARLLDPVAEDGFRIARPVAAADGRWVVDGWTAARWVAGEPGPSGRWAELLAAARAFHAALEHVPRPAALRSRTDRWARADRSAWGEAPPPAAPALAAMRSALVGFMQPVTDEPQLVHGDLSGNVLYHPGLPPAVIDVSPYWRPTTFAEAVVVADGLLWWGAGPELVAAAGPAGAPSWIARGLLFRLDTLGHQLADSGRPPAVEDLGPFQAALDALRAM